MPNDLQLEVRDPATKQFEIYQPTQHFLDKNTVRLFASCGSVWKGYFRSVTDWVRLVFITDFIALNLSSVHWLDGLTRRAEQVEFMIVLFDLLFLISSLSDLVYSSESFTSNIDAKGELCLYLSRKMLPMTIRGWNLCFCHNLPEFHFVILSEETFLYLQYFAPLWSLLSSSLSHLTSDLTLPACLLWEEREGWGLRREECHKLM